MFAIWTMLDTRGRGLKNPDFGWTFFMDGPQVQLRNTNGNREKVIHLDAPAQYLPTGGDEKKVPLWNSLLRRHNKCHLHHFCPFAQDRPGHSFHFFIISSSHISENALIMFSLRYTYGMLRQIRI